MPHSAPTPAPLPSIPLRVCGARPPWHRLGGTCCARPLPPRWCGAEPARDGVRTGSHPPPSTEGGLIMPSATRRALRSGYWFALAAFSATAAALPAPAQAQTPTPGRGGTLSLIAPPQPPPLVRATKSPRPTLHLAR